MRLLLDRITPLFVAQSAYGVDAGGANGGDVAGDQGDRTQDADCRGDGQGVECAQSVEPGGNQAGKGHSSAQADYDSDNDHDPGLAQNHGNDFYSSGAEGHADTNLIRP